jgi:hypothetical protein
VLTYRNHACISISCCRSGQAVQAVLPLVECRHIGYRMWSRMPCVCDAAFQIHTMCDIGYVLLRCNKYSSAPSWSDDTCLGGDLTLSVCMVAQDYAS